MSQHCKSLLLAWDLGVCLKRRSANEKILSIQIEYDSKLQFLETPFFFVFFVFLKLLFLSPLTFY